MQIYQMVEIRDLMIEIKKDLANATFEEREFCERALRQPDDYEALASSKKTESRTIGEEDIPHLHSVLTYHTNDCYELQNSDFREKYPEFEGIKERVGLVDHVESVHLVDDTNKVELEICRYIIKRS